jgi:hypothetical protein
MKREGRFRSSQGCGPIEAGYLATNKLTEVPRFRSSQGCGPIEAGRTRRRCWASPCFRSSQGCGPIEAGRHRAGWYPRRPFPQLPRLRPIEPVCVWQASILQGAPFASIGNAYIRRTRPPLCPFEHVLRRGLLYVCPSGHRTQLLSRWRSPSCGSL